MKKRLLSKIDSLLLVGICIKAATGVIGSSLILSNAHPYITLSFLTIGAISNEIVQFIKNKQYSAIVKMGDDNLKNEINDKENVK